jgi:hypothetical protein
LLYRRLANANANANAISPSHQKGRLAISPELPRKVLDKIGIGHLDSLDTLLFVEHVRVFGESVPPFSVTGLEIHLNILYAVVE